MDKWFQLQFSAYYTIIVHGAEMPTFENPNNDAAQVRSAPY